MGRAAAPQIACASKVLPPAAAFTHSGMLKASQNRTKRAPLTAAGNQEWEGAEGDERLPGSGAAVEVEVQVQCAACGVMPEHVAPEDLLCSSPEHLLEASMSRHPASTAGWLATTPTVRPSSRAKPAGTPGTAVGQLRKVGLWCVPAFTCSVSPCCCRLCASSRLACNDVLGKFWHDLAHMSIVNHLLHHAVHVVRLQAACGSRGSMGSGSSGSRGNTSTICAATNLATTLLLPRPCNAAFCSPNCGALASNSFGGTM